MSQNTVECLAAGHITMPPGGGLGRATHPFIEILVIEAGRICVRIDGRAVSAGPGEAVIYRPHALHQEDTEGTNDVSYIHTAGYGRLDPGVGDRVPDRSGRLTVLAKWLREEMVGGELGTRKTTMGLLFAALLDELGRQARPRAASRLERVRTFMRHAPAKLHTIASLAHLAGLSRCHFAREYRKTFGSTPMADLRQIRVDAASHLLLTTDLPLKAIADRVGFCDEYHFSRVFREYRHLSPGEYRHSC